MELKEISTSLLGWVSSGGQTTSKLIRNYYKFFWKLPEENRKIICLSKIWFFFSSKKPKLISYKACTNNGYLQISVLCSICVWLLILFHDFKKILAIYVDKTQKYALLVISTLKWFANRLRQIQKLNWKVGVLESAILSVKPYKVNEGENWFLWAETIFQSFEKFRK